MSKMRINILGAVTAICVVLGGVSGASAAPVNGNVVRTIALTQAIQEVQYSREI